MIRTIITTVVAFFVVLLLASALAQILFNDIASVFNFNKISYKQTVELLLLISLCWGGFFPGSKRIEEKDEN